MRNLPLLFFLFIFAANPTYSQDTINVPGDYATIQAAIDAANNGDVVLVAEDTYVENINYKGKAITVASHFLIDGDSTHIENTIIDGSLPSDPDSGSVVYFTSGEDTTSVLCGFTITGGTGTLSVLYGDVSGGGIFVGADFGPTSSAKICNNIIEYNSANNTTYSNGGGIAGFSDYNIVDEGSIIIENNLIRNNTATGNEFTTGGGISILWMGYVRIVNNKIIDNTVTDPINGWSGGIEISGPSVEINVIGNYIKGNACDAGGGGIDFYECSPIVKNNLIVENSAQYGGGVYLDLVTSSSSNSKRNNIRRISNQNSRLNNSEFNSSEILLASSFENNTIVNNTANVSGGGIEKSSIAPLLRNFIIWGNTAPSGPQISGNSYVEYSDVEGGWTGTGNIDLDPQFIAGDYYFALEGASLCIDAGNPDAQYNDVEDPNNPGNPWWPAQGTLRNDMGHCGGPASLWPHWDWPMPVESSSHSVSEFALMHNYPNPFNPITTMVYWLREKTNVELKVFDILGREVVSLVNEEQPAGSYEIVFDAIGLPSGVYFYRIQAGDFVETKKMVLMK